MSKILKGLNEVNPHNYDSDWDYQDAVAKSGRSRSSYRSQEDDTSDADIAYSKKMYQLSQKQKRDADHDRLATGTNEEQLDELSNEKLGQYKTAAAADAGKADIEGDYKRADKRFSGIVKATKKQFANDTKTVKEDINVVYKKAKQLLTQLDENTQQRVINALKKRVVKEFEGDMETVTAPTTNKPPRQTFSIVLQGKPPKDFEARFAWAALQNVFPNDYPPGSEKAEWKIVEVSKKGSAIIKSGINNRDIAETLVAKLVKNKVPAPCLKIISSELDEADEKPAEPFKTGYPRVKNPQILGTQNRAKSIYHPPSKPNVKKLDKPLPESLGDELTSKSIQALQQVKQQLEQQRMAELEQWEKDFKQNTVSKFTAREPNLRQRATSTSMVAMPGEKHSELKARLVQLNKAIEKQSILDNLVQRLDKKGLMTPNIEAGVDTSMLARDGARDNYVELNKKLDKALEYVKNRLMTNKAAYAKPKAIDEEQLDELSCWSGYHRVAGTKAGFPGSCAKNKTNEESVAEGIPADNDMGSTTGGAKMTLGQWKQMWMKKMPNADFAAMFRSPPNMRGSAIAYFDGWMNNPDARWDPQQGVAEGWKGELAGGTIGGIAGNLAGSALGGPIGGIVGGAVGGAGGGIIGRELTKEEQLNELAPVLAAGARLVITMAPKIAQVLKSTGKATAKAAAPVAKSGAEIAAKNADKIGVGLGAYEIGSSAADIAKAITAKVGTALEEKTIMELAQVAFKFAIPAGIVLAILYGGKKVIDSLFSNSNPQQGVAEEQHSCPHCGGEMVSEELMNEKKDACYYKVKSRYKVWPSAYASGALVKCRKKGASNWGNGGKKNESSILEGLEQVDENLHKWFKEKWVRFGPDGKIRGDCARGDDSEGKPKCLPQSKAHSLGKKGRASAAQRKRREDPNPERSGKAINVDTKKSKG